MLARSRKEAGTTPRKRTGYDAACYYDGKLLGRCTKADSDAYTLLMNACGGEAARFEQGKTQQHRISHASPDRPDGVAVGGDTLDQHRIDGNTD